jgi:hypothetical protein
VQAEQVTLGQVVQVPTVLHLHSQQFHLAVVATADAQQLEHQVVLVAVVVVELNQAALVMLEVTAQLKVTQVVVPLEAQQVVVVVQVQ